MGGGGVLSFHVGVYTSNVELLSLLYVTSSEGREHHRESSRTYPVIDRPLSSTLVRHHLGCFSLLLAKKCRCWSDYEPSPTNNTNYAPEHNDRVLCRQQRYNYSQQNYRKHAGLAQNTKWQYQWNINITLLAYWTKRLIIYIVYELFMPGVYTSMTP